MSGEYSRLLKLDSLTTDDSNENSSVEKIKQSISDCETALSTFLESATMSGQLASVISEWVRDYNSKLGKLKAELEHNSAIHNRAREAMATARRRRESEAEGILMSSEEFNIYAHEDRIEIDGVSYTGRAYAQMLRQQSIEKRDEVAKQILAEMNEAVASHKDELSWGDRGVLPTPLPDPGQGDQYTGTRSGSFSATAANASSVASSASFSAAALKSATAGGAVITTKATSQLTGTVAPLWKRPAAGQPGSASNPINDPAQLAHRDLLNTPINRRMTPDGPTEGYLPRDPKTLEMLQRNRSTSEWLKNGDHHASINGEGSASSRGGSAAAVGGMIGIGATATAMRGTVSGVSSLVTSTAGGSTLTSTVGGTGLVSNASAQTSQAMSQGMSRGMMNSGAASATQNTGRATGSGTSRAGVTRTGSAGAPRTATGAGSSAGRAGAAAPHAGTGAKDQKDRKRSHGLVGYEVTRIEDEAVTTTADSYSLQEGKATDLAPINTTENNQW
ncbi:hypothetical protein [Schaalia vaccimaxillae]|uniref:hypothetical protein n=1 Tax=Schaalia vaccimaxillae TaxID=183916 RepID=UPI0003B4B00E|nr:hypothetical protein [Schaalia vaccimaxillae]